MRYYDIQVTRQDGTTALAFSTLVNGATNGSALQVDVDAFYYTTASPTIAASVKIWGVGLDMIGQAANYNGMTLTMKGGMSAGLPLANPAQQGIIAQGLIQQAFGNWVMTNQWIEFIVLGTGQQTADQKLNISNTWKKGQKLADAIKQTLAVSCPHLKVITHISDNLVLGEDDTNVSHSLVDYAQYLQRVSQPLLNDPSYTGVNVAIGDGTFTVNDFTQAGGTPKTIAIQDLVGQPTWIDPNTIQVMTVMRGDINIFDQIALPKTQITTAPQDPNTPLKDKSIFQGNFNVYAIHHVGSSRQPDANSWATIYDCSPAVPVS